MGINGSGRQPLLLWTLLLLLSLARSRAQEQLDEDREGLGCALPSEFHEWSRTIIYRSSESSWKVPNTYLVVFKESHCLEMESVAHQLQAQAAKKGYMFEVLHVFKDLFPGILMRTDTVGALNMILRLKEQKYIEEDSFAFAQSLLWSPDQNSSLWDQSLKLIWQMRWVSSELDQLKNSNHINKESPVEVYLLGTSVHRSHQEIKDRIIISNFESGPEEEWLSTSTSGTQEDNCESHGTHLAALVSGQNIGMANNVSIHSLRVLNCQGKGPVSRILMGLEFIWKKLVSQPSKRMVVLLPLVITVGAVDYENQPFTQGSLGTNYGSCVDIFAPGKRIVSAAKDCDICYVRKSGTAQAAAYVAGIAAQMLTSQPNLTVAELRQRLIHYSIRYAINYTWFSEDQRMRTPNVVASLTANTQETGGQLLCRTVWSETRSFTLGDAVEAYCAPGEELLGCSSFSESGKRQGERVETIGNRRVCLAFGDRQVSAVARCCLLPRATCSDYTASPALEGLKTYSHCQYPDQVLTGCSSHWEVEKIVDYPQTPWMQGRNLASLCVGHKEASVHASCCHAPGLQCKLKKYRALNLAEKVSMSCDAGWTLTSCSAHPEPSVTLGAFPVDNACVVRHQEPAKRERLNADFTIFTLICCQIQPSGQM